MLFMSSGYQGLIRDEMSYDVQKFLILINPDHLFFLLLLVMLVFIPKNPFPNLKS